MGYPRYESDDVSAAPLAQPLEFAFANRSAPNRFLKGAMTERLSSWDPENLPARGVPSDRLINLYKRWGEGEIGLILSGNIMFEYDHLEAAGNPIIPVDAPYEGERFENFSRMATEGKKNGMLMVGQVSHPGKLLWYLYALTQYSLFLQVAKLRAVSRRTPSQRALSSSRVTLWA
jgi:2,4-dienoyl-CoA reductase-like NADH-dependent reductase (Old Yellow Enzyme family)